MKRQLISSAGGLVLLAFAGSSFAATPGPADVKAVVGNLGPAVQTLAQGLQNTATTLANTQSAVQTSAALGSTVANTASALVAGAPNLGAAGLLPLVANAEIQSTLHPILNAIDNPTSANFKAALAPQDLNTIVGNLQGVPFALIEGAGETSFNPYGSGLRWAGIGFLQGNPKAAVLGTAAAIIVPAKTLVAGTNYQPLGILLQVSGIGLNLAATPVFHKLQGPAGKLAAAGAPLTTPIVGILKKGF